jgi:hypothetical protein
MDSTRNGLILKSCPGYVWAPGDRPPFSPGHGQILISDKPKLIHLRAGYFAERKLYSDLAREAIDRIESVARQPEAVSGAHVLWFGGRSGCGKSVALLHVLSRLHQEGIGPIVWLGSGVSRLAEAVRRVPSFAGQDQTVLIAVDDPYAPHTEGDDQTWRDALSELETLQNRGRTSLPILVCCGPTDQAERLSQDFAGEVAVHVLPVDSALVDRKELESWYRTRTGKNPPAAGDGDVLLVQLFFEWQTGKSLKAFAKNFRKRLLELDPSRYLFELVCRILSANRLYTGYPLSALAAKLTPTQIDAFRALVKEHHFAVDEDADRAGVWLTHPHLADVVFDAWLPAGSHAHERWAVIAQAILDGLNYGETARDQTSFLWALARQVRGDDLVRRRVEVDNPKLFIPDVYAAWRRQTGFPLPISYLPAWITILCRIDGLVLEPDPIAEAFERLLPENRDETGFRLTCHKLLEHWASLTPPQRDVAKLRMINLLKTARDWHEWSFIAEDMALKTENPDICELVGAHLQTDGSGSLRMLTGLLLRRDTRPNADWMFASAIEWIERHIDMRETGQVLSATLKRRDLGLRFTTVSGLAIGWSRNFSPGPMVERVLRRLLKLPHTHSIAKTIAGLVFDYIDKVGLAPESSFLLGPLLRPQTLYKIGDHKLGQEKLSDKAIALGLRWIRQFACGAGMPYVADQLLRLPPSFLADEDWRPIASLSLSRLTSQLSSQDADYSLNSIARRRHLLRTEEDKHYTKMLWVWLQDAENRIHKSLSKKRYRAVIKTLAAALPLSAHLGDGATLLRLESTAKKFRKNAPEDVRASFDRLLCTVRANRAWPDRPSSILALKRIGVFSDKSALVGKVERLLAADPPAFEEEVEGVLDAASDAAKQALA